jgi:hypothetical protein
MNDKDIAAMDAAAMNDIYRTYRKSDTREEVTNFIIIAVIGTGAALLLTFLGAMAYLSYEDSRSEAKPQICKVKEKYIVSNDGHIQDREMRTSCGKLSVGKRVKVWDSIEEGKTYELMIKGGRTGLPDVMAAKEVKP